MSAGTFIVAALGGAIGGALIKRAFPFGFYFVFIWAAVLSELTFPTLGANGARIGKALEVAPREATVEWLLIQVTVIASFLGAFGLRLILQRASKKIREE